MNEGVHIEETDRTERSNKVPPYTNERNLSDENLNKDATIPSEIQRFLFDKNTVVSSQEIKDRMKSIFHKRLKDAGETQFERNIDTALTRLKNKHLIKRLSTGMYAHGAYKDISQEFIKLPKVSEKMLRKLIDKNFKGVNIKGSSFYHCYREDEFEDDIKKLAAESGVKKDDEIFQYFFQKIQKELEPLGFKKHSLISISTQKDES